MGQLKADCNGDDTGRRPYHSDGSGNKKLSHYRRTESKMWVYAEPMSEGSPFSSMAQEKSLSVDAVNWKGEAEYLCLGPSIMQRPAPLNPECFEVGNSAESLTEEKSGTLAKY